MRLILLTILAGLFLVDGDDLAVVRPFASRYEAEIFSASFDQWNTKLPCNRTPPAIIDLFLVYSRDLDTDIEANRSVHRVVSDFQARNRAWHSCFRDVYVISVNLTAEEDVYDPRGAEHNPNWVSGPNAVFRSVLNTFLESNYKAFFFMELDSIPRQAYWLERFVQEVEESSGAAISGSRYRGDNWDFFRSRLSDALLLHLNGNAIYHVSHPFLAWISRQLNKEADTEKNSMAFDVRISELIFEASRGITPEYAQAWADFVPAGSTVYNPGSKLIANFANTLLNESFDSGSYIMHGSPLNHFPQLDESKVTLALSHFSSRNWYFFRRSVGTSHPFRKINLLTVDETVEDGRVETVPTQRGPSEMTWNASQQAGHMSLCEVASYVDTEFFAFADTLHVIASPVSILMNGNRAVVPYLKSNSKYCRTDLRCTSSLAQAQKLFNVTLEGHYDKRDTLFRTDLMQPFCEAWAEAANGTSYATCGLDYGPTADDYVAWIVSSNYSMADYYHEVDREVKGWRSWLLLHTAHPPDQRRCGIYNRDLARRMGRNLTGCHRYVEQPRQCNADARCMWRKVFQTGKCIPFNAATLTRTKKAYLDDKEARFGINATNTTTSTTSTTTFSTTITATTTTSTTSSTSTTTTPLMAVAASVLIPIAVERVTEQSVGALLAELEAAAEEVKQGTSSANYVDTPDVWVELTEQSSISLLEPPTEVQKQIYFASIRDVRCGVMTKEQCDVREPNATIGLKATRGAKPRLLQDSSRYDLLFEVFMMVYDRVEMRNTVPLDAPEFLVEFVQAVTQYVADHSELSANESTGNMVTQNTTVELIGYLTPPTASALTVVEIRAEETAPVNFTNLQAEFSNTTRIIESVRRNAQANTLVGTPSVDLCLGRTCGGNGVCAAGVCLCDPGWSPPSCLLPITAPPTAPSTSTPYMMSPAVPVTTVGPLVTAAPITPSAESNPQAALISIGILAAIGSCTIVTLLARAIVVRGRKYKHGKDNNKDNNKEDGSEDNPDPAFSDEPDLPTPVPELNEVCTVSIKTSAFAAAALAAAGAGASDHEMEPDLPTPVPAVRAVSVRPSSFDTEDEGAVGDASTDLPADRSIRAGLPAVDLEDEEEGPHAQAAAGDDEFGAGPPVADEAEETNPEGENVGGLIYEMINDEQVVFV